MSEQENPATQMSKSRSSRRKARHLPPGIQSHPSKGTPANPSDPFILWSSGSPCPRCGDVFVFDASKILRPLQRIPCSSCGKNTNAFARWAMIGIAAYFGALALLLLFFPETAFSPAMEFIAPLGFFCVLGLLWVLAAVRACVEKISFSGLVFAGIATSVPPRDAPTPHLGHPKYSVGRPSRRLGKKKNYKGIFQPEAEKINGISAGG